MIPQNLRILCISPSCVPNVDPEAFCGGKMVLALMKAGCDVTVLSYGQSGHLNLGLDPSALWQPVIAATAVVDLPPRGCRLWSVPCAIRYRSASYPRWYTSVVEMAGILHRAQAFDVVYSRSLPMIAHVAGYWCARALARPWIANINDPWDYHMFPETTLRPASWPRRVMSEHWLRKTLRSADLVTYPSARLRDFHIRMSGLPHPSAVVNHVGCISEDSTPPPQSFHLVHAGRLADPLSNRSASALLPGLRRFLTQTPEAESRTRLTLVGPESVHINEAIAKLGLQKVVTCTGRVSYQESLRYIGAASVCLLVEGKMTEGIYLPSKFADYAVARKPILALSPAPGVVADLLPRPGLLRVAPDDVEGVSQALGVFYHAYVQNKFHTEPLAADLTRSFTDEDVARTFLTAASETIPTLKPLCKEHIAAI